MKMIIISGMRVCSSSLQTADLDRILDRLRPGAMCLHVPLVDDAVQVGVGGDFPTTTIAVTVTASSVRVRRVDGRRLQVHIVEDWRSADEPGVAIPVFGEPVDSLVIDRCGRYEMPGPGRLVARNANLDRFVGTLTRFALAKQDGTLQARGAA